MTKIRKYNGVYKLPIHKHTPKRRPVSRHITLLMDNTYNIPFDLHPTEKLLLVQDISKLENPLFIGAYEYAKPSLLTRVKERFKK